MTIKQVYQIEGNREVYDTEQKAILADFFNRVEDVYLESYKKERLIQSLSEAFFFTPIVNTPIVQEVVESNTNTEDDLPF